MNSCEFHNVNFMMWTYGRTRFINDLTLGASRSSIWGNQTDCSVMVHNSESHRTTVASRKWRIRATTCLLSWLTIKLLKRFRTVNPVEPTEPFGNWQYSSAAACLLNNIQIRNSHFDVWAMFQAGNWIWFSSRISRFLSFEPSWTVDLSLGNDF